MRMGAMKLFLSTMEPHWSTLLLIDKARAAAIVRFVYGQILEERERPLTASQTAWMLRHLQAWESQP